MKPHVTAEWSNHRLVVFGRPEPDDETHDCDALGCGSVGPHVLERLSAIEAAQELYRLRARVTELEASCDQLHTQLAGCLTAAEGATACPAVKGDYGWSVAYQKVLELRIEHDRPPVVPEGWIVEREGGAWRLRQQMTAAGWAPGKPAALRAFAWAIEHDQRPPHARDDLCLGDIGRADVSSALPVPPDAGEGENNNDAQ